MGAHAILGHLFALDDKVTREGLTARDCIELEGYVILAEMIEDLDMSNIDTDALHICNLGGYKTSTFHQVMDDLIKVLSEYLHPIELF
jgi:alpha-L-arabinofuranosidase